MYLDTETVLSMVGGLKERIKINRSTAYILNSDERILIRSNSKGAAHYWYGVQDFLLDSEIDRIVLVLDMDGICSLPFEMIKNLANNGCLSVDQKHNYKIVLRRITGQMCLIPLSGTEEPINIERFFISSNLYRVPDELDVYENSSLIEGAKKTITVNAYERNPQARKDCISHYGAKCFICGFDFSKIYGSEYEGIIEVHHIVPLNEIDSEYVVNPINDLIPLCPNCHTVIHRKVNGRYLSVEEVKKIIQKRHQ